MGIGLKGIRAEISEITERKMAEDLLRLSDERLRQAVRVSDLGIFDHCHTTDAIYWSPEQRKIYGVAAGEEILLASYFDRVYPEDRARTAEMVARAHDPAGDGLFDIEHRIVRSDGEIRWLSTRSTTLFEGAGPDRRPVRTIGAVLDITERKRVEQQLLIAAKAFESREAIAVTDENAKILRVNESFTRITGYSAEEAVGRTPAMLKSGRHKDQFYRSMWQALKQDRYWQGEIWNRRKNGEVYPELLSISAVADTGGRVTHYIGAFTDISKHKEADEKIRQLAFYDPLTRLPNRRLLYSRLRQALSASARHENYCALLFIDLDNFKRLNDTKGHSTGDMLLTEVAQRLQACVGEGDTVARVGGDEFVIMLEDLSEDLEQAAGQAEAVGEKILAALRRPHCLLGHEHHSSASIGIGLFHDQETTEEELFKRIDTAMYQAKNAGRDTLRFFDPSMQTALEVRAALEGDLRNAMTARQFRLYYQMQVDKNGLIHGAEVLIRWLHPERGLVSPLQFIPLAEDTGLILPIGQWVLETACAQLEAWAADPITCGLRLAVNVSARQFHQPDFVEQVAQALRRHAVNPDRLSLELTESVVLDDIADTVAKMRALKELAVRFSMDDFGTGYSSLAYLSLLPLDQLKIDQSFVRNIGVKATDEVIVQTIIGMAGNLGMRVIAEGVETEAQRAFLERNGCPLYQGYLFGNPVPVEEFEARLGISK